jgi:tetratricopeptide (TPR) repeat protein
MGKKEVDQSKLLIRDAESFLRAFRKCVAETQSNQAQIYQFFNSNRAQLTESLLEALPLVFAKFTADQLPKERNPIARLFWNFGYWIRQFPLGDRMLNLELSITACQLALQVYTHKNLPLDWAMVQNALGVAYSNRIRGNRAENLEQAITAFQLVLQVYTREDFPQNWAVTQNNLGNIYCERIQGNRAGNLEQAIVAFKSALQVYTREFFPEDWAMTQNNLGIAYCKRSLGDRAENLEQAIATFQLALQVRTQKYFPQEWAGTQNNLGTAYVERIQGERAENLEQAIIAYQLSMKIYTREAFSEQWTRTQSNLAGALMERASLTSNSTDLDTAITLLQSSLNTAVRGSSNFIDSQYWLGNALSRRYEHSQNSNDLQQALQAYKTALDAISPEHYDRKQMWQAIPATQSILGSRLVRDGQWQEGLQLLLNSVRQLSTGDDPLAHANALFQTGRAHEILSDWDNARLYYRDALRLYEHLNNQLGIAKSCAGLGGVLVSQGHLENGMAQLAKAREHYHQLQRPNQAAELKHLYQAAQRAMEQQATEVYL